MEVQSIHHGLDDERGRGEARSRRWGKEDSSRWKSMQCGE
jgi:hypothetical protein